MRSFEHFPKKSICPICGTNEDKEAVLIAIVGTQDGYNAEASIFHLDCLELWYDKENKAIYQKF